MLQLFTIIAAYYYAKDLNLDLQVKFVYFFTTAASFLSAFYFFFVDSWSLETIKYPHYFLEGINRLLGLDKSPALLGFLTGLSIAFLLFDEKLPLKFRGGLSFLFAIVLFFTASRTAILGLAISLMFAVFKRANFTAIVMLSILSPLVLTICYINDPFLTIPIFLENITSNRVIIWSNIFLNFINSEIFSIFFGIGKPPENANSYYLSSYSGSFIYSNQSSVESSWLKLMIYHGVLLYIFFLFFTAFSAFRIVSYSQRVIFAYLVFGAIFYDFLFSVQYYFLGLIFMTILKKDNVLPMVIAKKNYY